MWEVSYTWPEACRNYVKISNYIVNRLFHTPGCESWENLEPQLRTLQTQNFTALGLIWFWTPSSGSTFGALIATLQFVESSNFGSY